MGRIYLLLGWSLSIRVIPSFYSLSDHHYPVHVSGEEECVLPIEVENCRQFYFVEKKSQFFEVSECPKEFMFVDCQNWIDGVVVLKGVFDETFSIFYIDS